MKKAIMYGAGKIGRGFVGRKLVNSGFDVCFLDNVQSLVDMLNREGEYTVRVSTETESEDVTVRPLRALNSETDEGLKAIVDCDLLCTAVGANSLPDIAKVIARAGVERMRLGRPALDIIICENQLSADVILRDNVYQCLNEAQRAWAEQSLGFVPACIGCTVPSPTPEMKAESALLLCMEPYMDLPVDRTAFKGEIPEIEGLIPFEPFEYYIKRKLFLHNGAHAMCAYMGWQKGYGYIHESIADPEIYAAVRAHMLTVADALCVRFGEKVRDDVNRNVQDLLKRFKNQALMDTLSRVGADPLRKLRRNDRLVGAALFELENGIDPAPTLKGVAAALKFVQPDDITAPKLQQALAGQGVEYVATRFKGLKPEEPLYGMILKIAQ